MKHTRIFNAILVIGLIAVCTAWALDSRQGPAITFTGSHTLTISASHPNPCKLNAVTLTFANGEQTNCFDIYLTRAGASASHHIFTTETNAYTTAQWLLDGRGINLAVGDSLFFTNSANTEQVELIYDYEI